jgi:hypothetical protein
MNSSESLLQLSGSRACHTSGGKVSFDFTAGLGDEYLIIGIKHKGESTFLFDKIPGGAGISG